MPDTTATDREDDLLDIHQISKRLNLSERSVRTLVALGHLPKVDMAPLNTLRFDPRDVEAFIESRRSKPRTARGKPPAAAPTLGGAAS